MLSGVDERIEEVPHHVCLAPNNGLISDIAASRFRVINGHSTMSGSRLLYPRTGHSPAAI
jgi:hypothetical protein